MKRLSLVLCLFFVAVPASAEKVRLVGFAPHGVGCAPAAELGEDVKRHLEGDPFSKAGRYAIVYTLAEIASGWIADIAYYDAESRLVARRLLRSSKGCPALQRKLVVAIAAAIRNGRLFAQVTLRTGPSLRWIGIAAGPKHSPSLRWMSRPSRQGDAKRARARAKKALRRK